MKKYIIFALLTVLCLSICACANNTQVEIDKPNIETDGPIEDSGEPCADYMPFELFSESQLNDLIKSTKGSVVHSNANQSANSNVFEVDDKDGLSQTYNVSDDMFNLKSISKYYKPKAELNGYEFLEISVKKAYVSFSYKNADEDIATFTWFREMSPEVAMNELYGRGEIERKELTHNGITYVFLGWANEQGAHDGYSVHWVKDGKAFQASVPPGYTDDELLEFCTPVEVNVE